MSHLFYANVEKKELHVNLFDETAEKYADKFVGKDYSGKPCGVGRTQLRRLYNEVKRFEQKLDETSESWENILTHIKMIKSKASYNIYRARENAKNKSVFDELSKFIKDGIDAVKEKNDYRVFAALFEAVYGFYYEKSKDFEQGN